jgi:hypothetical protein
MALAEAAKPNAIVRNRVVFLEGIGSTFAKDKASGAHCEIA